MDEKKMTGEKQSLIQELEHLSFEEALQKLEEIVNEMERGNLPLEKMITSFEKGSILASACQSKLDALRTKIEILRKDRQSGSYKWTPLQNAEQPSVPENTDGSAAGDGSEEDVPF